MKHPFTNGIIGITPDGTVEVFCEGTPVQSIHSDGAKPTRFKIILDPAGMLSVERGRGSRVPDFHDVLNAILEVTNMFDSEGIDVFTEKNVSGNEYFCAVVKRTKYSIGITKWHAVSFRDKEKIPAYAARAIAEKMLQTDS